MGKSLQQPKAACKIPSREKLEFVEGGCQDCIRGKSFPFHTACDLFQENYTTLAKRPASKLCPRQNLQDIS